MNAISVMKAEMKALQVWIWKESLTFAPSFDLSELRWRGRSKWFDNEAHLHVNLLLNDDEILCTRYLSKFKLHDCVLKSFLIQRRWRKIWNISKERFHIRRLHYFISCSRAHSAPTLREKKIALNFNEWKARQDEAEDVFKLNELEKCLQDFRQGFSSINYKKNASNICKHFQTAFRFDTERASWKYCWEQQSKLWFFSLRNVLEITIFYVKLQSFELVYFCELWVGKRSSLEQTKGNEKTSRFAHRNVKMCHQGDPLCVKKG